MQSAYQTIVQQNLQSLYRGDLKNRSRAMAAELDGDRFQFRAFGGSCAISPTSILLDGREQTGPLGIILSLYALNAAAPPLLVEPLKAFKELPNSMPYVGAFASHTEQILTDAVGAIIANRRTIMDILDGGEAPAHVGGDSSMLLRPLPKVALCYIFYEADEDFPASATCLFSSNADSHMPMDGLADVGEYTSRKILELTKEE